MAKRKSLSSKMLLVLAALSVLFCWMYGIVGLGLGIFALSRLLKSKGKAGAKRRWTIILSVTGIILSLMTFIFYMLVFINGAYIRFF